MESRVRYVILTIVVLAALIGLGAAYIAWHEPCQDDGTGICADRPGW